MTALARAVLQLADLGGMPGTIWQTDSRVRGSLAVFSAYPATAGTPTLTSGKHPVNHKAAGEDNGYL